MNNRAYLSHVLVKASLHFSDTNLTRYMESEQTPIETKELNHGLGKVHSPVSLPKVSENNKGWRQIKAFRKIKNPLS